MVGETRDLPTILFVNGILRKRDDMLDSLALDYPREEIKEAFGALRRRVDAGKTYATGMLTDRERAKLGPAAQLVEGEVLGWKIRAVLSGDRNELFVTQIRAPAIQARPIKFKVD